MSTRSELKENILANKLEGVVGWMVDHKPAVLGGAGFLLFGAMVASVMIIKKNELKEENWWKLANVQAMITQKRSVEAHDLLNEIRASGADQGTYLHATYLLAETALQEKKYDEALQHYQEITDQGGSHPLIPLTLSNMAFTYEQKGNYAQAAETYQLFMTDHSEHFLAARIQFVLGRALVKAGQTKAGKEALGQLVDLYPTSKWAQNARQILDRI